MLNSLGSTGERWIEAGQVSEIYDTSDTLRFSFLGQGVRASVSLTPNNTQSTWEMKCGIIGKDM